MNVFEKINERVIVFDGAMGTMLQAAGLKAGELPEAMNTTNPEAVVAVHRAYIEAGADVISANCFSSNDVKLAPYGMDSYDEVYKAVKLARRAATEEAEKTGKTVYVAADLGPTGKLMHPLGDFSLEEAVRAFAYSTMAAEDAGADLIFFETFSDLYECKAAIIAARENTHLPVAVSLTFDENGRTLTGADSETAAAYLSALGVDAIGINCGLGPDAMEPIAEELAKASGLPIIVNANAGLPKIDGEGKTYFDIPAERFYSFAKSLAEKGIAAVGGCCGTTPEYIKCVCNGLESMPRTVLEKPSVQRVCSGNRCCELGGKTVVVGERLNPTGKPKLKEALKKGDLDYLCAEAVAQEASGADILDVNVGIPDIDEAEMLPKAVLAIQKVTSLPLQLDSASPRALALAARVYNGIPIINSVNGKEESMSQVLPIVRRYGAKAVALLLDEKGIPDNAEGRLEIAKKIAERAEEDGISPKRLLFDALTMTVATDKQSGEKTLECVEKLSKGGFMTALGVSNISFGMPNREAINASFLGAAAARGLTAAIINPASEASKTVLAEENPCPDFVFEFEDALGETKAVEKKEMTLFDAVMSGLSAVSAEAARKLLETVSPIDVVENYLVPALNALGEGYEQKKIFLPRLLGGAEAAKAAFKEVNNALSGDTREKGMKIVMATVKGDIHDIGKNIVSTLLSNYGFDVIDLGKDVSAETVLATAIENSAKIVGLSALMTTTVPSMAETVALLKEKCPNVKIMVGGAVLTQEYADAMGADFYGEDAMASVRYAMKIRDEIQ